MKYLLLVMAVLLTAACRAPDGPIDENLPRGVRVMQNGTVTGTVVKFVDGDVVCYALHNGISCIHLPDRIQ